MPIDYLGPYKIERMLGRGGMGAVYVGVNQETGERAALKVLSPTLADDPGFQERFKAEIETLKKLRHPNIVQLHGYGEHDGHLFYAMELVEGRTLQEELQAGRKFDWREVCRIGIAICQGLKHAHDVGVIHRDLKPANLLVTKDGTVKLSDFGIAKLYGMTHLTADGGVLGTADYMAPEQADGKQATPRCDMYSLGSVLYALLARRPPFAAPTMPEVLHALKYDEPPPVRRYAHKTPAELESILNELLEKDPQKRIASPLLLSNRLKAMLHALSEEKDEEPDEFVIRLDDDPPKLPLSQQTTMGSGSIDGGSEDVTFAPTPTRPMTDAPPKEKRRQSRPSDVPTVQSAPTRTFTTVEKESRPSGDLLPPVEDEGLPLWAMLTAAALLVAVIAGLGWYYMSPPTANSLFAKIEAAAEADDPAALANVESQIDQFVALHSSDPRYEQVQEYQQEVNVYRFQRRLEIRARRGQGASALQPIEQAYLDAMTYERAAPELAAARLQALIDVYGTDKNSSINTRRCVDLARKQLARLRERLEESGDEHAAALNARLAAARAAKVEDPEKAKAICRGIITLYSDKPWAADAVAKAKGLLGEME